MKNWDIRRAYLYILVGGYLLYTAYKLFNGRSGYEGIHVTVMLIFSILFFVIGIVLLGLVLYMYYKAKKCPQQDILVNEENNAEDNLEALQDNAESMKNDADSVENEVEVLEENVLDDGDK